MIKHNQYHVDWLFTDLRLAAQFRACGSLDSAVFYEREAARYAGIIIGAGCEPAAVDTIDLPLFPVQSVVLASFNSDQRLYRRYFSQSQRSPSPHNFGAVVFYSAETARWASLLIGAGCAPVCSPLVENSKAAWVAPAAEDGPGVCSSGVVIEDRVSLRVAAALFRNAGYRTAARVILARASAV